MYKHRSTTEWEHLFVLFETDLDLFKQTFLDEYPDHISAHDAFYRFRKKYLDWKVRDIKTFKAKQHAKDNLKLPKFYLGKNSSRIGTFHSSKLTKTQ